MNKKTLEEVFKAGTNWGVTFSTWFTPSEEDHKKHFEDAVNEILSTEQARSVVQPEVSLPTVDLEQNRKEVIAEVVDILQTEWSNFLDDEVVSENEFRPIDAFYKTIMDKINSRWTV